MKKIIHENLPFVKNIHAPIDAKNLPNAAFVMGVLNHPDMMTRFRAFPSLLMAPLARAFQYDHKHCISYGREGDRCWIEFLNAAFKNHPNARDHYVSVSTYQVEPEFMTGSRTGKTQMYDNYYNTLIGDDHVFDLKGCTRYAKPVHDLLDLLDALVDDQDKEHLDEHDEEIIMPDARFIGTVHQACDMTSEGHPGIRVHQIFKIDGLWVAITLHHLLVDSDPMTALVRQFMHWGEEPAYISDLGMAFNVEAGGCVGLRLFQRKKDLQYIWDSSEVDYSIESISPTSIPAVIPKFNVESFAEEFKGFATTMHHWLADGVNSNTLKILARFDSDDESAETFYFTTASHGFFRLHWAPIYRD